MRRDRPLFCRCISACARPVKPSKRDIYCKLDIMDRKLNAILAKLVPDFSHEDATVLAMSAQIKEALSHLPPATTTSTGDKNASK